MSRRRRAESPYIVRRRIELRSEFERLRRKRRIENIGVAAMIGGTLLVLAMGLARGSLF